MIAKKIIKDNANDENQLLEFLNQTEKGLKKHKKHFYYRIKSIFSRYPVASLCISILLTIFLGFLTSALYDLLKWLICR